MNTQVLKNDEKAIFEMRSLYRKYGYSQYKMSKFEEYDLYVRNKDFLVSDNIITFTDTNGKLMALKPDVTLSIIKNTQEGTGSVHKVYYDENVYRVSKGTHSFKEIMQVGLECIGDIDDYCIYEVIMLAAKSLENISPSFVLDISHMGIVSSVLDSLSISHDGKKQLIKCIGEKNIHGITSVCADEGIDGENLKKLVSVYGSIDEVIPMLDSMGLDKACADVDQLKTVVSALEKCGFKDKIRIDFSAISDTKYYNGFVFKGFIEGISESILSGGQYDRLMHRVGKNCGAIGFAVYLDMLEFLTKSESEYDVDAVILYDESQSLEALTSAVSMLTANGKTVMAQKAVPEKIKYKQLLKLNERGVEIIENNA